MTASHAYLVVERERYLIAPEALPDPVTSQAEPDAAGGFCERLRAALDKAARLEGYASIEAAVRSARTPTPTRVEHVRQVVAAGLLDEDAGAGFAAGAVPDVAWEVLRAVDPERGQQQPVPGPPEPGPATSRGRRAIYSWALTVHRAQGIDAIDVDIERFPADVLPLPLILETLDALALTGWTVVHVSEDRSIDDAASRSVVVRQRFLLRRERR